MASTHTVGGSNPSEGTKTQRGKQLPDLQIAEVEMLPNVWKPISKLEARDAIDDERRQYGINYRLIAEIVASGNPVVVSLDYVTEGALRQGIAYHSTYMGFLASCRLTKDHRHIIVTKGYTNGNTRRNSFYRGT